MVACIIFVFATLNEFTIVIFLKYYLRHLPVYQFPSFLGKSSKSSAVKDRPQPPVPRQQVWTSSKNVVQDDDDDDQSEAELLEERQQASEKIILRIEKYSVIVFFFSFLIFNIIYWYDIIHLINKNN